MNIKELKNENITSLKLKLISLYREKLKIVFEKSSGSDFNKTHLIRKNRKNIARILTLISEKKNEKI